MGFYHAAVCHSGQWEEDPKPQAVHGGTQLFISGRFESLNCVFFHKSLPFGKFSFTVLPPNDNKLQMNVYIKGMYSMKKLHFRWAQLMLSKS